MANKNIAEKLAEAFESRTDKEAGRDMAVDAEQAEQAEQAAVVEKLMRIVEDTRDDLTPSQAITTRRSMRLIYKLETERQDRPMSDAELRELWAPTFTLQERVRLFIVAPKTLLILNAICQVVMTGLFVNLHINLSSQLPSPQVLESQKRAMRSPKRALLSYEKP